MKIGVPARIARAARILVILACFAVVLPRQAAAQDRGLPASVERIMRLVADGRNIDAVDTMKTTFEATPPADRQSFFVFAAHMCVALSDVHCATHFVTHDSVQDLKVGDVHASVIGYRSLLAWYIAVMGGSPPPREHMFDRGFPVDVINPINAPVLFAEFQLLAARQSRLAFDFEASRDQLDKALASALVLQNERFDAPRLLVRIAGHLLHNHDVERALRLVAAAEPILRTIPSDSLLNFDFLHLRGTLNGYRKDFAAASHDLRQAIALLDRLQLKPDLTASLKAVTHDYLLGMEALRGDRAAVNELLQSHPLLAAKPEILERGYFANESEFQFAVTEEFARLFLNDRSESGWYELLKMQPKWTTDPERLAEVRAFGQAAIGLQLARMGKLEARREFIAAARTRLATLQQRHRQSAHAAPLPYWTDQLLLELALAATLTETTPDYELVLGAHIVLNRSLETGPDDVLASQAVEPSDERKRAVQALHTIDYQRTTWEKTQLAALAGRLSSPDTAPSDATFRQRYDIVQAASDLAEHRQRLRAALSGETSQRSARRATSLAALKELLLPDEALVFHVPMLDHTGKVCVRTDRVASSLQRARDGDAADVRLLAAALTAAHPPSIEADSQYPADAAVRLGKLLFGGLEDCLRTVRRVYHVTRGVLAQVPPAALLAEVPPRLGPGFDLRQARWLVRDHSFIKTSSIDSFVAARKLSKYRRATLDYLGVGDPVLATPTNALSSLAELPETSEELQRVGRLFEESRVRILRRDAASEEHFRLQPLSEFDVMHFATHGLMREEIPGLPEPSLVLTPDPKGDAFSDGLLTTSQIAALSLRTRLVVLSACNSARYEASIVESGIQGLSTAFTIAGVPATIAALWPIDSSLTRDLIIATFQAARGDSAMPLADALATAMRRHLEGPTPRPLLHPRFWSALVVLGDGSMRLGAAGPEARRDLAAFADIDMTKSEEILSMAPVGGEDVASSTIGPWNGKRSPSLIRRQRADGTTKWEVNDFEIGAGPTAAIDQTIYAAGYLTVSAPRSGISVPVLRQLSPDGRVLWTRRLSSGGNGDGSGTMVMALAATHDRMALALVGPRPGASTTAGYYIARIDATGAEAGRTTLAFAGNLTSPPFGVLAGDGADRLAIVNRGPIPGDRVDHVNGYGIPQVCLRDDAADIVFFDVDAMRESGRSWIDRFNARSALAVDGGWLVVGSLRDGCGIDTRAAAFMVKADGTVQEIWRDRSPFVTNGQGVRRIGKAFEIVGRSRRSVAIREGRPTLAMPDFSSLRMGDEAYVSDEIFSVQLSEQGKEESTDFVAAGLPIMPMGMISTPKGSVIHGTIGSRPLWLSR